VSSFSTFHSSLKKRMKEAKKDDEKRLRNGRRKRIRRNMDGIRTKRRTKDEEKHKRKRRESVENGEES
jgi:hypothetical protein